jgi:tRNA(fMet)-specific endonuclease VapC
MDSQLMGMILDTSTIVSDERKRLSVAEIFNELREAFGETTIGISVVTLVELTHAIERAKLEDQRKRRAEFLEDVVADIQVCSVTPPIAQLAGKISGQQGRNGISHPFQDLLIASTAPYHGFAVVTENVRHFQLVPSLVIKSL